MESMNQQQQGDGKEQPSASNAATAPNISPESTETITVEGTRFEINKQDGKVIFEGGDITQAYNQLKKADNLKPTDSSFEQKKDLVTKAERNLGLALTKIAHEQLQLLKEEKQRYLESTRISENGQKSILNVDNTNDQKLIHHDISKIPPYKRGQMNKYAKAAISANKQNNTTEKSGAERVMTNIFRVNLNEIDLTNTNVFERAIEGLRELHLISNDDFNIPADFMAELGYQRDIYANEGTGWKKSSPKVFNPLFEASKPQVRGNELSQALSMPDGPIKDEKLFTTVSDIAKFNDLKNNLEIRDLAAPKFGTAKFSQDVEKEIKARIAPTMLYDETTPSKRDNIQHAFSVLKNIIIHHHLDEQSSKELLLRFVVGHTRSTAEHEFFVLKHSFEMVWSRLLRQSSWNFGSNAVYEQELKTFTSTNENNFSSIATSLEKLYHLSIKASSDRDADTHMIKAYGLFKTHLEYYVVKNYNEEVWYRILTRSDDTRARMTNEQRASNQHKLWSLFIDAGEVLKNVRRAPAPSKNRKSLEPQFKQRNFSSRILNVNTDRSQRINSYHPKGYGRYCLNCNFRGRNEKFQHFHHSVCPFYQSSPVLTKTACAICAGYHVGECMLKKVRENYQSSFKNRQPKFNDNKPKSFKTKNSKDPRKPAVFNLSTSKPTPVSN